LPPVVAECGRVAYDITVGRLAEATGMSKSGRLAHFGSKRNLQLATVHHAVKIFVREV